MIVLLYLFLNLSPVEFLIEEKEYMDLMADQEVSTSILSSLLTLHPSSGIVIICSLLVVVGLIFVGGALLIRGLGERKKESIRKELSGHHFFLGLIVLVFLVTSSATNVAFAMDLGGEGSSSVPLPEQGSSDPAAQMRAILEAHEAIAAQLRDLRTEERVRVAGGYQLERIVEMMEEKYGGPYLLAIQKDLKDRGLESRFYHESKELLEVLKRSGGKNQSLHKEWMGKKP